MRNKGRIQGFGGTKEENYLRRLIGILDHYSEAGTHACKQSH